MCNRFILAIVTVAATIFAASAAQAQQLDRPATIAGHPSFNGIWQALNTAYWNLEGHSVQGSGKDFWPLGAIAAIPAGQSVLLVNFEHHTATTPYRSNYAIYVNEAATQARQLEGELPPVLRGRPIALRAFDADGMLVGAELALNDDVEAAIGRQFANPDAAYLHAHNAAHGCFAARIDRR